MLAYSESDLASDIGEVSAVGWHGPANMTFEEWMRVGNTLQQVGNSINWRVGDWLNYGEAKWGEMYTQAIEITGWEYQRLADAKFVCSRLDFSLRNEKLSWSLHKEVAKLQVEDQLYWLNRAYVENMRVRALRDAIRQSQLPPPAPVDDVPFSSAAPRIVPIHTNGNGYRTPVEEYEQAAPAVDYESDTEDLAGQSGAYTWTEGDQAGSDIDGVEAPAPSPVRSPMAVHFSSESPEHYTPQSVIDATIKCMGAIDLDPCSNSHESPNVPAAAHFTAADDGLRQVWRGRVYMNPPYGREIVDWVDKLVTAHESGDVTEAIALVPARTDTRWWAMLRDYPVCLVSGRLKFGEAENSAPFPSAVFYLPNGTAIDRFYDAFSLLGDIWQRTTEEMIAR